MSFLLEHNHLLIKVVQYFFSLPCDQNLPFLSSNICHIPYVQTWGTHLQYISYRYYQLERSSVLSWLLATHTYIHFGVSFVFKKHKHMQVCTLHIHVRIYSYTYIIHTQVHIYVHILYLTKSNYVIPVFLCILAQ